MSKGSQVTIKCLLDQNIILYYLESLLYDGQLPHTALSRYLQYFSVLNLKQTLNIGPTPYNFLLHVFIFFSDQMHHYHHGTVLCMLTVYIAH